MNHQIFNRECYLKRISDSGPLELSAAVLRRLTRAHLETVPFENLDILELRRAPSLELDELYRKVVERHRGGYCFELNSLFYHLLTDGLGFRGYPVAARILWRRDFVPPLSHRASVVEADGEKWLCDVGFGGPGPKGILCLTEGGEQTVAGERFRVRRDGDCCIIERMEADWEALLSFRDAPFAEADFSALNTRCGAHPDSVFTKKRVVYLCTPDGSLSLVGSVFTARQNGTLQTVELESEQAVRSVLKERFGLR